MNVTTNAERTEPAWLRELAGALDPHQPASPVEHGECPIGIHPTYPAAADKSEVCQLLPSLGIMGAARGLTAPDDGTEKPSNTLATPNVPDV